MRSTNRGPGASSALVKKVEWEKEEWKMRWIRRRIEILKEVMMVPEAGSPSLW